MTETPATELGEVIRRLDEIDRVMAWGSAIITQEIRHLTGEMEAHRRLRHPAPPPPPRPSAARRLWRAFLAGLAVVDGPALLILLLVRGGRGW